MAENSQEFVPAVPKSITDTGLGLGFLHRLAIKTLYREGDMLGFEFAERMGLPHAGVVDELLSSLKQEQLCEVTGTGRARGRVGLGGAVYRYQITDKGRAVAREAMERSQYVGPAPVPLAQYNEAMERQALRTSVVQRDGLEMALADLVLDDATIRRLGGAVNSRRAVFLFGPPGNGKTAVSEGIGELILRDAIWIPYAAETGNEVIRVFDSVNHVRADDDSVGGKNWDPRWLRVRRPVIAVGGEMTLAQLDLIYDRASRYYEAPLQMKANGGMLLVDDFGRQQVRPRDLLNRWIVPLEKRTDYLALHTGRKIQIPFETLVVFATNLAPTELVDEAFLRRIRHKIEIPDPTWDEYREIFRHVCREKQIAYDEQALAYVIKEHYIKRSRPKRRCHPRDLIDQIEDIASYLDVPPELSQELLDQACKSYFVDL